MAKRKFDIAVIGAGTGGYVTAIKASQSGRSVCLIEKKLLGGTCLNVGCIPTKTLIANAQIMHKIQMAADYGIHTGAVSFDFAKMKERKDKVVSGIRKNLEGLILSNKITIIHGSAEFLSPREIKIKGEHGEIITAENIVIATGSEPLDIPAFPCDHKKVFNSTSILELTHLPKKLAIIGGGYIGCEFASLYAEFGVQVTILEALPSILSLQGKEIAEFMTQAFIKKGIEVKTNVFVQGIDKTEKEISIKMKDQASESFDMALVAVGRKVISSALGLEKAGVKVGEKGEILVNDKMQTNVPGIYAVGDVTGKLLLAHVASHQGLVAAANILGHETVMHYEAVPAVIFTYPEVATVGMTLEQAKAAGYAAKVGKFPFQFLGKSIATIDPEGYAEVIIDQKTGQILGAYVIGHEASSLIAEMALAIDNELTVECVIDTIHAHPTIPEAWLESALVASGTPIHLPPKKR
ncbi:MAG TPA: dihydrolipoyl dehydrogenase [Rhabdochlamydiaceae bacterium]|nr:dihydrolipoyl dehydrogenase [Rhabdochlamydiaceae bacterium]